jgi:oligopeptide/dipeptide ABC transporter ATP-binding protein
MNILEVKNLNLGFWFEKDFKQALFDVTFSMEKGKMLSIVGESGCGKTMSAMSILNLIPKTAQITSGEIIYNSENLLKKTQKEMQKIRGSKIALIPQDPMTSLNPLYTVGDQLLEIIKIHQNLEGAEAIKKAIEAFEAVQIPDAKSRLSNYPHEFSGGMKQRAIIAMALACNAEILIADEPTTALDVTIQAQIMNILNDIKTNKGTSILLITHDLALVSEHTDDIAVMYAGRIVEQASNEEFFSNPKHPYSKALLKSLPSGREEILETIQGQPPSLFQEINGCKFNPRCEFCKDICIQQVPLLNDIENNHKVACWVK